MDLKDKIRKAVMRGINESFDIKDMGNDINTATATKQKVSKDAKLYKQLKRFVDTHSFDDIRTLTRSMTEDELDLVAYIVDNRDMIDDETLSLIDGLDKECEDIVTYHHGVQMVTEMVERVDNGQEFTTEQYDFIDNVLSQIKTKDHILYACYRFDEEDYYLGNFLRNGMDMLGYNANLNWIDTSNIYDMKYLFSDYEMCDDGCLRIAYDDFIVGDFEGDISLWDVSNVNDMMGMFAYSSFNGDISQWDVSNVDDMKWMFAFGQFNGDISKWDVSNVNDMTAMFEGSAFRGDISGWKPTKLKFVEEMFYA